jgi:hypothetical protein
MLASMVIGRRHGRIRLLYSVLTYRTTRRDVEGCVVYLGGLYLAPSVERSLLHIF